MTRWVCLVLFFLLGALPVRAAGPKPVAITHVTVIDATGRPAQADMTVIVEGGRLRSVGKADRVSVPQGAEVVDGRGRFLIPGLWDMHVHIASPDYLKLFLANGVTGVREMHAFLPDMVVHMRDAIDHGKLQGPRLVVAGALVDGPKPFWPGSLVARNASDGRAAVRQLKQKHVDFVKVYSKLPRDAFFAIAQEAKRLGLPFAGHVPESVSAAEASDAGQKSMEHFYGVLTACSPREDAIRREVVEAFAKLDNAGVRTSMSHGQIQALESYDEDKARALFARFVKNGTWQCPTLTVLRAVSSLDQERFTSDPRLRYMPIYVRSGWVPKGGWMKGQAAAMANRKRLYVRAGQLVGDMHRAGVRFLAGTDTTNPYCFPGFSLHDELVLLVEAGLTPMDALQAATRNPAEYFGRLDQAGTIEADKEADLVLLEADPLADIHNTQKIAAVVVRGRLLQKDSLQGMLAEVARANGPAPTDGQKGNGK